MWPNVAQWAIGGGRVRPARARMLAVVAALSAGCSVHSAPAHETKTADVERLRIPVTIQTERAAWVVQSELADTPATRAQGLMFRSAMGSSEGMLFLFPDERPLSFWMKNTLIPLDMIFIRADHTVLGVVERATPETETSRSVMGASQFVLEVNGGEASERGVRRGDIVTFYAPVPLE